MGDPDDDKPPYADDAPIYDDDVAPLYIVERSDDGSESWRVVGPNGPVGAYGTEGEAQGRADFLNVQVAYDVRFAGGLVRYASSSSRQAAAEIALSGPASC